MSKQGKLIVGIVVAIVVVSAGCNLILKNVSEQVVENAMERASGGKADVDMKNGSMTIKTEEGTMTTGNKLPENWPTDIPMYAGATVQFGGAANGMAGDAGGMAVVMMSEDATADVAAYYKSSLAKDGWTVKSTMEAQGSTIYLAEKAGRTISVTVTGASGQTTITIGVQDAA